jgi:hypothetical protein
MSLSPLNATYVRVKFAGDSVEREMSIADFVAVLEANGVGSGTTESILAKIGDGERIGAEYMPDAIVAGIGGPDFFPEEGSFIGQLLKDIDNTWYRWDGSAWQADAAGGNVDNAALNDAIAEDAAESRRKIGLINHSALSYRLPRTQKVLYDWSNAAPQDSSYPWISPLRVMMFGDSLVENTPAFGLDRVFGYAGHTTWVIGSLTGGAAYSESQWSSFPNGRVTTIPNGGTAVFALGGGGTTGFPANRLCIGYIKEPGAGSLVLQHSRDNGSTWETAVATINCANATTIGAWNEYNITGSNLIKARVTASGGTVRIVNVGGWIRGSGGVIASTLLSRGGAELASNMSLCPPEIYVPIITGYNPDLVVQMYHDLDLDIYDVGAEADTMISSIREAAAYSATLPPDWVIAGKNPEDEYADYNGGYYNADEPALIALAERNGINYWDGHSIFGDYDTALAMGLMENDPHPSLLGYDYRSNVFVEQVIASVVSKTGGMMPTVKVAGLKMEMDRHPAMIASGKGWVVGPDATNLNTVRFVPSIICDGAVWLRGTSATTDWTIRGGFGLSGTNVYMQGQGGVNGFIPAAEGYNLGISGYRWNVNATGVSATGTMSTAAYAANIVEKTANYTITSTDHTVLFSGSTAGRTLTLPTATGHNRIYCITNISTVDVTVATTGGQNIYRTSSGATSITLAAGARIRLHSNGYHYIEI